ncbi:MAG: hypothetical protein ABSG59_05210 [Verrucomicrobiota bacterium]|jgi:hypothetical protein
MTGEITRMLLLVSLIGAPLLWTAVAERSGDTAFDFTEALGISGAAEITPHQSGVALSLLPPQS